MRRTSAALITTCLLACSACNTDPLWEPKQRSLDAPTTSISHPDGVDVPDIILTDASEVDLVEQVLANRAAYFLSLETLRNYYEETGHHEKRTWAEAELADVRRIKPFRYILSGEIPIEKLLPTDSIPEADELYDSGLALMREGGHGVPALYRKGKMRDALATFRTLIAEHPSSDKIDDAAFQCGEIHREYFKGEEELAVRWYERAFAWDPETPHPARFQAAVVYDLRLHDRDRALELYHAVIEMENDEQSNVNFALRRIGQLSENPAGAQAFVPPSNENTKPENTRPQAP